MACSSISAGDTSSIALRYARLHAVEQAALRLEDAQARDALITKRYQAFFPGRMTAQALRRTSVADLHWLFRAAAIPAFYTPQRRYVEDMQRVVEELAARGAATDAEHQELFQAMVALRDFAAARAVLQRAPGMHVDPLPIVPAAFDDPAVTAFDVEATADVLVPLRLDVRRGAHLVVVAHPACAFSRNAIEAIERDPALAEFLASTTVWMAPVSGRLHLQDFRDWNRAHPGAHLVQAWHAGQWPQITDWATPQFYALRDGKVVAHVVGWPKSGRREELRALLQRWRAADGGH